MMEKRVFVLFTALFLLFSAVALADVIASPTFFVKPEPVNDKILDSKEDYADFYVVIENKGPEDDTFKLLYFEDPKWSYQVLPSPIDKTITVPAGGQGKIHILVKGNVPDGLYSVKVSVQSLTTKNVIDNVLRIQVGESAGLPAPNFDVDVSVPAQMDPTGTYNIIVNIKNKNVRLLEDVNIKLSSNIITEDTNVTVEPGETKGVSFAVLLMEAVKPQEDQLHVTVTYQGEEFYSADHNFEVVEYLPPFKTDVKVEKRFLRQDRIITITNEGNVKKSDTVRIETSLKERFFSWSKPKFQSMKEEGKYFFTWSVSLEAGESAEMKLTTSYRILLLFALIIIALLAYKAVMANPLIVRKKIKSVHKEHGGAISDLSVVLYLKNRSKEPITNLRVVERVTRMVHLKKDSFEGSMHPVKMHEHAREGTLLEYRFGELAAGDTRIIKYKVYARLHIFGTLLIKPTVVEFTTAKGMKKKSRSNEISIATEERVPKPVHKEHHKPHHAEHKEHHEHKGHK